MKQKKILFISNIAGKKIGSFSIASIYAAHETGLEFHIASNFSQSTKEQQMSDEKEYGITIHQIDFIRNPLHPGNIKAYLQLVDLIKREEIDVIHCNTPVGGVCGRLAARKCGVKTVIYQAHGFHFFKGAPLINRTIFKWIEMALAHLTDVIITINKEDYEAAQKFKLRNNGTVYYVPGVGINTSEYRSEIVKSEGLRKSLGLKEKDVVCISMGDLIVRKNYGVAIKAVAKCKNDRLHYIICGQGPELTNLKKLAQEQGVENQVHFLGFRSDIKELLQIANIFLFTTLQEGMPRSMMEAMASGLPCIVSKIRGNTDLLEDGQGGFLIPLDDIDYIAMKINEIAENQELQKAMSERNLFKIEDFDEVKVKEKIQRIYQREVSRQS